MGSPKCQHLTTLQMVLDDTSHCLSVRAPIVAVPVLIKLTLSLGFLMDHWEKLLMVLHQFGLVNNTFSAKKGLKACANQH